MLKNELALRTLSLGLSISVGAASSDCLGALESLSAGRYKLLKASVLSLCSDKKDGIRAMALLISDCPVGGTL
jgi:hypothetical protein